MAYESHWSACRLALRFNGANGSQSFSDLAGLSTLTAVDTAALSTDHYDTPPSALYLDGNTTGRPRVNVVSPDSVTDFGTGALTIAISFRLSDVSNNQFLMECYGAAEHGFILRVSGGMLIFEGGIWYDSLYIDAAVSADTLHKVMIVRNGSDQWRLLLDGVVQGSFTQYDTWAFGDAAADFCIGGRYSDGLSNIDGGYIDELYFVHGVALEWGNYTPGIIFEGITGGPPSGIPAIPLQVTVNGSGSVSLPLRVSVYDQGTASVGVSVSVIDAAILDGSMTVSDATGSAAGWLPVVEIDGVDVSDDVVGPIEVIASEGDARVATFTLVLPASTAVVLPDYVSASVVVDIADSAGANRMRLFSGRLDLPDLDLQTRSIRCHCTDDLQNRIAATTTAYLDAMIGGRWSAAVFSNGAGAWRYAQDMLSTVPAALDISPFGTLRVTPWLAKTTADLQFDDSNTIDASVSVSFAERSALINEVKIDFGYRFPRIKSEGYHVNFSYITGSFGAWVAAGNAFLFRAAVANAIAAAGGSIVSITYMPLPTTAQVVGGGFWIPNPATDPLMCLGFEAVVSFDYTQDVDESHVIRVFNESSIAAIGLIGASISGALEGISLDSSAAETNILLYKNSVSKIPPLVSPAVVSGSTNAAAIPLTAGTDRAAAQAAMETLIDIAKVKISGSHRTSYVSAAVPLHPLLDVDKTVLLNAQGVTAKGKVIEVQHQMDADAGTAISRFSMAICSLTGLGIADAGDATVAPAGVADGVTGALGDPVCVYRGLLGQDQTFEITFPAVASDQRNRIEVALTKAVAAPLVEDILTIITP